MTEKAQSSSTAVVLMCTGLIYLEASQVFLTSTILPYVAENMVSPRAYVLPTTVFLLSSLIGIRLFISASDGRSIPGLIRWLLFGFLVCTVVCALAPNFGLFIAGRGGQGLFGGALSSLAYLAVNQYFKSDKQRMLYMAWMSFMWSVSCITGPLLGGIFVELGSWRMAIAVNVLWIALLAAWSFRMDGSVVRQSSVRLPGAHTALLFMSIVAVMFGSTFVGSTGHIALGVSMLAVALFTVLEVRSDRPFVSAFMFERWSALYSTLAIFCVAALVSSTGLYLTLLAKELHQSSAVLGGLVFSVEAVGWGVFGLISSRINVRFRSYALLVGSLLLVLCTLIMAIRISELSLLSLAVCNFGIGMGIGICWPHITNLAVAAQAEAGHKAAAFIPALQIVGSIYGASMMSFIFNLVVYEADAGYVMAQRAFGLSLCLSLVLFGSTLVWRFVETPAMVWGEGVSGTK